MIRKATRPLLLLLLSSFLPGQIAFATQSAGEVAELTGRVWATLGNEAPRKLAAGDPIFAHDYIRTYPSSQVKLIFRDKPASN